MKTLHMLPITKHPTNMLAHAENDAYEVKIRYWGKDDVNDIHLENATADDINIFVDMKMPDTVFPRLDVGFSDRIGNICTRRFDLQFRNIFISSKDYDMFLECAQVGKDTLDDIVEILTNLVPHLMTEEYFKKAEEGLEQTGKELEEYYAKKTATIINN